MIREWIARLRAARWWGEALQLTSKSEYQAALEYVVRLEQSKSSAESSKFRFYERLLKGYLLGAVGRKEEALAALRELHHDLQNLGSTNAEVKYLRCYAAVVGADILGSSGFTAYPGAETPLFPVNYAEVDLEKVPRHVRRYFPLRYHPRWTEIR